MSQPDSKNRKPTAVEGKRLVLGVAALLLVTAGVVFYVGRTGDSTHVPLGRPGVGFTVDPVPLVDAGDAAING